MENSFRHKSVLWLLCRNRRSARRLRGTPQKLAPCPLRAANAVVGAATIRNIASSVVLAFRRRAIFCDAAFLVAWANFGAQLLSFSWTRYKYLNLNGFASDAKRVPCQRIGARHVR